MNATDSVLDMFLRAGRHRQPAGPRAGGRRPRRSASSASSASRPTRTSAGGGDRLGHREHLRAACRPPCDGDAHLPERPSGHRAAHGCDRAGGRATAWSPTAATTILGADNKAAVAAMLAAVRDLVRAGRPHAGRRAGAHADGGGRAEGRQGVRRLAAAGRVRLLLRPRRADRQDRAGGAVAADAAGSPSAAVPPHSGMAPEQGRSAILAAARAIAEMPLGRIDAETTTQRRPDRGRRRRQHRPAACAW